MIDLFLTNNSDISFLDKLKESLRECKSFYFSVSFITKPGLILFAREIEEALKRGVKGRIITSTYQNFTDIPSLKIFNDWKNKYPNFDCHLDFNCFLEKGFHSKGYIFEKEDSTEIIIGSTNITSFALLKNVEWNISLSSKEKTNSFNQAIENFNYLWDETLELNDKIIEEYSLSYKYAIEKWDMDYVSPISSDIPLNYMQQKALKEIRRYRGLGVQKALIISSTGSGKTYLAAFDARNFDAKKLLFVVHRESILKDALESFKNVFGTSKTYGLYTGNKKELNVDFLFATSSMLSKHLEEFAKDRFDYICYDEAHHIVTPSGKKIFNYFKPSFLLGLTATPERMDNKDVFELFEENVPFELRLRDAILNDLVVPFHYYGIRAKLIDYGIENKNKIAKIIANNISVDFIVSEIEKHRPVNGKLKAIAFCTSIEHCRLMASEFQKRQYNAISLFGLNTTGERLQAFKDIQDENNKLEIICTVDILNEGVDIPALNMVLFLRPTESSTIFLQQLGRGLRKYKNKKYLTVLDFIGNNYDRSVQIAFALGTLSKSTYIEKKQLKDLIDTDFNSLNLPGVKIDIDKLSKEEIKAYLDKTNFNTKKILQKDYENFKKYLNINTIPKHTDYLESEFAPDLLRFIKSKINNKRMKSYYNFLSSIGEDNIFDFNEEEQSFIENIEELLPLVRVDEYLIIKYLIHNNNLNIEELVNYNSKVTKETLNWALDYLEQKQIIKDNKLVIDDITNLKDYLEDLLNYGIRRYEIEFGDYEGLYKLYANYTKEQSLMIINQKNSMNINLKGTYFDKNNNVYIWVGLKKDKTKEIRKNYKDKFISPDILQWESENNTTRENSIGKKLLSCKKVYIFVRKMDSEDNINLPFTYFGTGTFSNIRDSFVTDKETNVRYKTLLFDVILDNKVPKDYHLEFNIPKREDDLSD